jgi:hypothetical protein
MTKTHRRRLRLTYIREYKKLAKHATKLVPGTWPSMFYTNFFMVSSRVSKGDKMLIIYGKL